MLFLEPVVLDLNVEVIRTEDLPHSPCELKCLILVPLQKIVRDRSAQAGRCGDDPIAQLIEHLEIHARLIVEAFQTGAARQLQEVPVASLVLGQQEQMIRGFCPVLDRARREVGLNSQDRMKIVLPCRLVPVDDPLHDPVIGDRQVLHPQFSCTGHVVVYPAHSIQQRVLRMEMQVRELLHDGQPLPTYSR